MQLNNLALIAAAEVAAVLLVFCVILIFQNRSLRGLVKKLQSRMEQLVEDLKAARSDKNQEQRGNLKSFAEQINDQLELTKDHHKDLKSEQDIVLDLAPDIELPKRAAALRYAILLAEKECVAASEQDEPNWELLRSKYEQIFDFYSDYTESADEGGSREELDALSQELSNAKKRINNLEKFKALYFDLEEQWEASKEEAQTHYNNLSEMSAKIENGQEFESALESYHASYNDVNNLIERGIGDPEVITKTVEVVDKETAGELRHLRMVASDQHKLITELQSKLRGASTDVERNQIMEGLQDELQRQQRFIQESETCIQLMEDELNNTNRELDQLKSRLKALPSIKTQLKEIKTQKDEYELKVYALTSENRKLTKKLKEEKESSPIDTGDTASMKKELIELETRYASLEEKYLDLKLQQ